MASADTEFLDKDSSNHLNDQRSYLRRGPTAWLGGQNSRRTDNGPPWLRRLITRVERLNNRNNIASIPVFVDAINETLHILKVLQQVEENSDELRDVARGLVRIIRSAIRLPMRIADKDQHLSVTALEDKFDDYLDLLSAIQSDIHRVVKNTKWWRWYFKASSTRKWVAKTKGEIDDLDDDFTNKLHATLYHQPSTWGNSKPVRLIDAMDISLDLPRQLCATHEAFHRFLSFYFQERRGRSYIEGRRYDLTIATLQCLLLTDENWSSNVEPGVTIVMDILLNQTGRDKVTPDSRRCPACGNLCRQALPGDEVRCPSASCGTLFCVQQAFLEEIETGTGTGTETTRGTTPDHLDSDTPRSHCASQESSSGSDTSTSDISHFRRFRIKETIYMRESPAGPSTPVTPPGPPDASVGANLHMTNASFLTVHGNVNIFHGDGSIVHSHQAAGIPSPHMNPVHTPVYGSVPSEDARASNTGRMRSRSFYNTTSRREVEGQENGSPASGRSAGMAFTREALKELDAMQIKVLEETYNRTAVPSMEERLALAKLLNMTPRTVQIWFTDKRLSVRRIKRRRVGANQNHTSYLK